MGLADAIYPKRRNKVPKWADANEAKAHRTGYFYGKKQIQ